MCVCVSPQDKTRFFFHHTILHHTRTASTTTDLPIGTGRSYIYTRSYVLFVTRTRTNSLCGVVYEYRHGNESQQRQTDIITAVVQQEVNMLCTLHAPPPPPPPTAPTAAPPPAHGDARPL